MGRVSKGHFQLSSLLTVLFESTNQLSKQATSQPINLSTYVSICLNLSFSQRWGKFWQHTRHGLLTIHIFPTCFILLVSAFIVSVVGLVFFHMSASWIHTP